MKVQSWELRARRELATKTSTIEEKLGKFDDRYVENITANNVYRKVEIFLDVTPSDFVD
jgi:hypothetical protein